MPIRETITYHLRIMCEETSLFQPDGSLSNKVPIPVEKKQYFNNRPGGIPDVDELQPRVYQLNIMHLAQQTHFISES
jgi:hypothetical protein